MTKLLLNSLWTTLAMTSISQQNLIPQVNSLTALLTSCWWKDTFHRCCYRVSGSWAPAAQTHSTRAHKDTDIQTECSVCCLGRKTATWDWGVSLTPYPPRPRTAHFTCVSFAAFWRRPLVWLGDWRLPPSVGVCLWGRLSHQKALVHLIRTQEQDSFYSFD